MKAYKIFLVLSVIGSIILAGPDVATILLFATLGLGIPLLFLPTIAYYLLAALPGTYILSQRRNSRLGIGIIIAGIAAAAILPGLPGLLDHWRTKANLSSAAINQKLESSPRSIEIIRPEKFHFGFRTAKYPESECGSICTHLIKSGQVDRIRIKLKKQKNRVPTRILFIAGKTIDECAVPGFDEIQLPCVTTQTDDYQDSELTIEATAHYGKARYALADTENERLNGWIRYVATDNRAGEIVYSDAQQTIKSIAVPTVITTGSRGGLHSGGFYFWQTTRHVNQLNFAQMLVELGFNLTVEPPSKERPKFNRKKTPNPDRSRDLTRQVLAILDFEKADRFNPSQMKVITDWWRNGKDGLDPAKRDEIIVRIIHDRRAKSVFGIASATRRPEIGRRVLPVILNKLPKHLLTENEKRVMWGIRSFDRDTLVDNREEIKRLLNDRSAGKLTGQLIVAGAYAGVNPAEYLEDFQIDTNKREYMIQAYCYLEPVGNSSSVQFLRSMLANAPLGSTRASDHERQLLQALASHGDMEPVRKRIARSEWRNKDRWPSQLQKFAEDRPSTITKACDW